MSPWKIQCSCGIHSPIHAPFPNYCAAVTEYSPFFQQKLGIGVKHLESRPSKEEASRNNSLDGNSPEKEEANSSKTDYFIEFESPSQDSTTHLLKELESICSSIKQLPIPSAPASVWFPRHISELCHCCTALFKYGSELATDHPGYGDAEYVQRRREIAEISKNYK